MLFLHNNSFITKIIRKVPVFLLLPNNAVHVWFGFFFFQFLSLPQLAEFPNPCECCDRRRGIPSQPCGVAAWTNRYALFPRAASLFLSVVVFDESEALWPSDSIVELSCLGPVCFHEAERQHQTLSPNLHIPSTAPLPAGAALPLC